MNTRPSGLALWTASGVRRACVFPAPVPRGILLMEAPAGVAYRRISGGGGGDSAYWCISRGRQGGGGERLIGAWAYFPEALGGERRTISGEGGEAAYRLSGVLSGRGGLAYLLERGGGGGGNAYRCTWLGRGGGGGGGVPARKMQYVTYVYKYAICNICLYRYIYYNLQNLYTTYDILYSRYCILDAMYYM